MSFSRLILVGVAAAAILATAALYGLFHGYFDHGQFEIVRFQWSSTHQVAMVARRSDNEALGGLAYYVLIGDHLFTPAELRHAFYSKAVVLDVGRDCLTLRWDQPNRLTVGCSDSTIARDEIDAERRQVGNVVISFENIAPK
jgi:hypothetical protein